MILNFFIMKATIISIFAHLFFSTSFFTSATRQDFQRYKITFNLSQTRGHL